MGILDKHFPMGLGTSRLPIKRKDDTPGIEKSAQFIVKAIDAGVSYIDTAPPYANGGALPALKLAFEQTKHSFSVAAKVIYQSDKTTDQAKRRVEMQLQALGIDKAAFFICWCIQSYKQFKEIVSKGGVYDGAICLRDEGVVNHICASLHAPPEDSIEIIESGAFEAVTISFNYTNAIQTIPVLDAALKKNIDVVVMNPLGGGGIIQNADFFSFAQGKGESVAAAALRFAVAHPAVKVVLSGVSTESELAENLSAFTEESAEPDTQRLTRVIRGVKDIDGFCVNCRYCDGCPAGIPISELMSKRNRLLFGTVTGQDYRRADDRLLEDISLFNGQAHDESSGEWFPDSSRNPCTRCGRCEGKCTQKLNVVESVGDMYERSGRRGFTLSSREDRLRDLLTGKEYKRVGLYPKDRYAVYVVKLYERLFGEPDFEWIAFNSDPDMWGRVSDGLLIRAPTDIPSLSPDIIIICNYAYEGEIYNDLKHFKKDGIKIEKLHRETDVPWVF